MAFETFKQDDVAKMREAQATIVKAVMPMVERGVHPLLVVFAMARCLRVLLRKTTVEEQKQIRPALYAFIAGATEAPTPRANPLWTPDQPN